MDPYTEKASEDATPSQKLEEVRKIMKASSFSMLTTQSSTGLLHSRAMSPASTRGLHLSFIANLASGKFDDIETHSAVNVAFSDASSSDWISISGKGEIVKDQEVVDELWDPSVRSWFGDLKDGVHDGGKDDPRVGVIRVIPDEIRYVCFYEDLDF